MNLKSRTDLIFAMKRENKTEVSWYPIVIITRLVWIQMLVKSKAMVDILEAWDLLPINATHI